MLALTLSDATLQVNGDAASLITIAPEGGFGSIA